MTPDQRAFTRVCVASCLLWVIAASPGAAQDQLTGEYGASWALLIGVDHTPGNSNLNGTDDARHLAAALREIGFRDDHTSILPDPTAEQIRDALYNGFPQMGRNDRLVVFFSGHGIEVPRNDGTAEGYLLASNYNAQKVHTTAIAMTDLKEMAKRVRAKHVLLILDACFSGLIFKGDHDDALRASPPEIKPLLRNPVVEVLTAGSDLQRAYQVQNRGLLTKVVVQALTMLPQLEPTRPLTFTRLADWVSVEVSRESNARLTPLHDRVSGYGEFVLRLPIAMKGPDAGGAASPPLNKECPEITIMDFTKIPPESRIERRCMP